jgi:vancomycin resistance protein VanJ
MALRRRIGWMAGGCIWAAGLAGIACWSPWPDAWWLRLFRVVGPFVLAALLPVLLLARWSASRVCIRVAAALFAVASGLAAASCISLGARGARGPGAQQRLRVVTFNVWGLNPRQSDVVAWLESTGADVVALQEVSDGFANRLLPRLAARYPHEWRLPRADGRWTNAVVSRFVIRDAPSVVSAEPFERLTLDTGSSAIVLYDVHLSMPIGRDAHVRPPFRSHLLRVATRYDESVRDAEIQALVTRLRSEWRPFIVAGDFNLCERSRAYRLLEDVAKDGFREAGAGLGTTWPVGSVEGLPAWLPPALRIDYVWHAASFDTLAAWVGPVLGSDHRPVVVDLSLN